MELIFTLALFVLAAALWLGIFWYQRRHERMREEALRQCEDYLRERDPELFAKYGVPWKPRQ